MVETAAHRPVGLHHVPYPAVDGHPRMERDKLGQRRGLVADVGVCSQYILRLVYQTVHNQTVGSHGLFVCFFDR